MSLQNKLLLGYFFASWRLCEKQEENISPRRKGSNQFTCQPCGFLDHARGWRVQTHQADDFARFSEFAIDGGGGELDFTVGAGS